MKNKSFFLILTLEAILCIFFLVMQVAIPDWFTTITAFPFEQIGGLLRILSLSGTIGNIIAIAIYIGICLVPAAFYLQLKKKKKVGKTDLFLPVLSLVLFVVIYYMINPGLFVVTVPGTSKMILGMLFYSVFFSYVVLKILEKCVKADAGWLEKGLRILLHLVVILLVFEIVVGCFGDIPAAYQKAQEENYATAFFYVEPNLTITYLFLALQSVVEALPFALDIIIIFSGMKLLDAMKKDKYSEEAVLSAEKLATTCIRSLIITILSGLILNVLQVLLRNHINYINIVITIPMLSIIFAVGVLILAKYIRETQKVKKELDMFI